MHFANPILGNRVYLINYLIIWVVVIVTHILILSLFYGNPIGEAIADSLLFNILFSILGVFIWYPVKFIKVDSGRRFILFFNHLLIALILSGIWLSFGFYSLSRLFSESTVYIELLHESLPGRFFLGIFYYIGLILFYYLLIYYQSLQEKIYQEAELKNMIREAEMNMLKFQLNPHFIFNSLNSVSSLTITAPEKAREMIIKLSEFLRYSLEQDGSRMSSIENEMHHIENYLAIEKTRFGDKLEFCKTIEVDCMNQEIPSLILQPLFENAIKHGVYQSTGKVGILFSCWKTEDSLLLEVKNDFDPDSTMKKGAGIGLKNIAERLNLIYGKNNLLTVRREKNVFRVEIRIPCK